jgi:Amt family ammonium transporter
MLLWILLELALAGEATALGAVTGLVVGLVAVTPAAGYVTPLAALAIGCLGAVASFGALRWRTKVDDALDVFACHGVAGVVGALLTGVFATTALNPGGADGLLAGRPALLGIQALSILVALGFSALGTAGLLGLMSLVMPLRVDLAEEVAGLDQTQHGQLAYPGGGGEGGFTPLAEGVLLPLEEYAVPRDPLGRPLG